MNQSFRIYDLWGRNVFRLSVGSVWLGFGIVFWWGMSQEPDAHSKGWWSVWVIVAMAAIPGLLILALRRLVFLDLERRQFERVVFLFGWVIHRRSWPFSAVRCIEVRHGPSGDGHGCLVGFVPASGSPVWLRSFANEPATGPSEQAAGFAKELTETTGLKYEVRSVRQVG